MRSNGPLFETITFLRQQLKGTIQIQPPEPPVPIRILEFFFSLGASYEVIFHAGASEKRTVFAHDSPFKKEGGSTGGLSGAKAGAGGVAVQSV